MYVITINNRFYPDVEYAETLEEAEAIFNEWISERNDKDAEEYCTVTLAEVIKSSDITTFC